jgi:uncharacterized protein YndB with AHSA1/START domain
MVKRTVKHATLILERSFKQPPQRVFAAWFDPEARHVWMVPQQGWETTEEGDDFRVGGCEVSRFGPEADPRYRAETHYLDIVPELRIVMAGTISENERPITCSMATVEFLADSEGTRLVYAEQLAVLDDRDTPRARHEGWERNLDQLADYLEEEGR